MGHVRDLPDKKDTLTATQKKLSYVKLGIDVEHDFKPLYVIKSDKKKVISELKKELDDDTVVWIATDEDREGEAIGWHLVQALKLTNKPIKRIVFHEITKTAITNALENPREINKALVDAQQARRVLDRLVGFELSPLLWKKVRYGLSAGRVQSVAVRLVVERERLIQNFDPEEFWKIKAHFTDPTLEADLVKIEGKKIDNKQFKIENGEQATAIVEALKKTTYRVSNIEKKEVKSHPAAPFITSTLQQEASGKLGFSVKQTMMIAQQLYEGNFKKIPQVDGGLITYMRTDSVNLADVALQAAREVVIEEYGPGFALDAPRKYKTKSKGAQEAHEAIRPTNLNVRPIDVKAYLDPKLYKLYNIIWQRTIACQMKEALLENTVIEIDAKTVNGEEKTYTFGAEGKVIKFPGYMKVYSEGTDDPEGALASKECILPDVHKNQQLHFKELTSEQCFTKPPARFTEASLVKKLESEGIGRPSTYAPTISTIQSRGYIEKIEKKLHATDLALVVTDFLVKHFQDIMEYKFTAKVEEDLDKIADGEDQWVPMIKKFYTEFHGEIEKKADEVKKGDIEKERLLGEDPETGKKVLVLRGRFGPFVQLGQFTAEELKDKELKPKRSSLLKNMLFETITLEEGLKLLALPRELGQTEEGDEVVVKRGPYGAYLKVGTVNVSLPDEFDPYLVTLEQVRQVIIDEKEKKKKQAEPLKELGKDPNSKSPILIKEGKFGPYLTDGTTNVSIKKNQDPQTITHDEAVELLEKKRKAPKRGWGRKS